VKSKLITRAGFKKLQEEHDYLWREKRPKVTAIVSWAASLGDRSENGDYIFNKKLLREIDRRLRYLRKRLEDLQVVDYSAQQEGKVFFGASVEIENEVGEILTFKIAGPDEIYNTKEFISIDSPMARAMIKKQVDDEFFVETPSGNKAWFINKIEYT
jgi:transcription elongation factor GreB